METYNLSDLADVFSGYAFKSSDLGSEGFPVIKIANIQEKRVLKHCVDRFPETLFTPKLSRYVLRQEDILVAMTGAGSVGKIGKMPRVTQTYLVNQRVGIIRAKSHLCDSKYLYYVLIQPFYETYLYQLGLGAGQPNVSSKQIGELKIPSLPIEEQRRIAAILSAYDDLIENNTRRIQVLEEMARRIYEEWFVRFRFPGHENVPLIESELGLIPQGWKVKTIKDVCQLIQYGYTASAKSENTGIKFLRITDIVPEIIDWESVPYCEITEKDKGKYLLEKGDVVVARTGATTGYAKYINKNHPTSIFASYLVRFRTVSNFSNYILGVIVESDDYKRFIKANISGAAQPQANAQVLASFPIIIPTNNLQNAFDEVAEEIFDLKETLEVKNKNLRQTRDLLLQKLISGAIDVSQFPESAELTARG